MYKIIVKNFTKNRPKETAFEVTQNLNEFIPQLGDKIYLIVFDEVSPLRLYTN